MKNVWRILPCHLEAIFSSELFIKFLNFQRQKTDHVRYEATGMIKENAFFVNEPKQILIQAKDCGKLASFYRDVLGLALMDCGTEEVHVLCGNIRLAIVPAVHVQEQTKGLCLFFTLPESWLSMAKEKIIRKGLSCEQTEDTLMLKDPLGNKICLAPEIQKHRNLKRPGGMHKDPHPDKGRPRQAIQQAACRWQSIYQQLPLERLPWYFEGIDQDIQQALATYLPVSSKVLDLGCGPGTQAARLAAVGYQVLAVDIAGEAISKARALFEGLNPNLRFLRADVTDQDALSDIKEYDGAVDRGCFHSIPKEAHKNYVQNLIRFLRPGGKLILKTFSKDEPGDWGPKRFDIEELLQVFIPHFKLLNLEKGVFEGGRSYPKSLCLVLEHT